MICSVLQALNFFSLRSVKTFYHTTQTLPPKPSHHFTQHPLNTKPQTHTTVSTHAICHFMSYRREQILSFL